jgi:hypothetical protein
MRWAMALFAFVLIAAVALWWHRFFLPSPSAQPDTSAPQPDAPPPKPDQEVVRQFEALREEHRRAMRQFHQGLAAAGSQANAEVLVAKHPGKKYFQRFVELAEKHPEDPLCPHIVGYALHCAGPAITPEDHLRIQSILEQHHCLSKTLGR